MKDSAARNDIYALKCGNAARDRQIATLEAHLTALTTAFDELFDAVATDLGYKAVYDFAYLSAFPNSPRRLQKTRPALEIVRNKTRRCK